MASLQKQRFRCSRPIVLVGLGISLLVWMAPPALAKARYVPPSKPSRPINTVPRTSRGVCNASSTSQVSSQLTALAPISHAGQSSFRRPTFVWYVPDQESYALTFRLFDAQKKQVYQTEMTSQPGLMQFSLPADAPELARGQQYRWQVILICDPNSPSRDQVAEAAIAVVDPPSELQTKLAAATLQQRIDLYAEQGLWYDALAAAVNAARSQQPAIALDLIDSLASAETQAEKQLSDRLKQIVAIERQRNRL